MATNTTIGECGHDDDYDDDKCVSHVANITLSPAVTIIGYLVGVVKRGSLGRLSRASPQTPCLRVSHFDL